MKDRFFKHDLYAREDDKLMELLQELGVSGYGMWWIIAEMLYENDAKIDNNPSKLAWQMRVDEASVKQMISKCLNSGLLILSEENKLTSHRIKTSVQNTKNIIEARRKAGKKGGSNSRKSLGKKTNAKQKVSNCLSKSKQSNLILSNLILSNLIDKTKGDLLQDFFDYRKEKDPRKLPWTTERGLKMLVAQLDAGRAGAKLNVGWHNLKEAIDHTASKNWQDLYLPESSTQLSQGLSEMEERAQKRHEKWKKENGQ